MKNLDPKIFVYALLGISAVIWFVYALLIGLDLRNFLDFLRPLPTVAAIDLVIFGIFVKWAWRWSVFRDWLVPFPNLNGTWRGSIQTTWKDASGQSLGPIPAILTVKQSFFSVSCVMRTNEMTSYSYAEDFRIDQDKQIKQFAYSYTSRPLTNIRDRSVPHDGTIVLEIIGSPARKLRGEYWTSRKSTGIVSLDFWCKERKDELPLELSIHPMDTDSKRNK